MTRFKSKGEKKETPKKEKKYLNKTTYNRVEHCKTHPYTKISNYLIDDERLNVIEKGIMLELLKNSDTYIFNNDYFQKYVSGIGEDRYNKAKANLIKYGYIEQIRIYGGWNYVINEVPKGSINHTKMENTKCVFHTCGKQQMCKSTHVENTPLIITNEIGKPILKEEQKEKKNQIETITNEKAFFEENSFSDSSVKIETLCNTSTVIKNDLEMILNNNQHFNMIYDSANWKQFNISNLSNEVIAYYVKEKLDNNPIEGIEKKQYYFLEKLVEYSQYVENNKLYQSFINECKDREDLIKKLGKS